MAQEKRGTQIAILLLLGALAVTLAAPVGAQQSSRSSLVAYLGVSTESDRAPAGVFTVGVGAHRAWSRPEVGFGGSVVVPTGGGAFIQLQGLFNYWVAPSVYVGTDIGVSRYNVALPFVGLAAGVRLMITGVEIRPQLQVHRYFDRYNEAQTAVGFSLHVPILSSNHK